MKNSISHRRSNRGRRGTAVVEFALSLTFIVPVMLYAGYLTDALYDGVKAQEATAAAAWSFSGHLLHDYNNYNHSTLYNTAATSVRTEINNLYQGLDPWAVAALNQHPTELAGVSAKGKLVSGSICAPTTTSSVQDPSANSPLMLSSVGSALHTGGLISCQSQVEVTNWLWGRATGTSTTILGAQDKVWPTGMLSSLELCGVGAAVNSSCTNSGHSFVMYTDDWGLAEAGNASPDDDWSNYQDYSSTVNQHFANLGQIVYEEGQGTSGVYSGAVQAAEALAVTCFVTAPPIDPVPALDKQWSGPLGTVHDTFNLAEVQWNTSTESMDSNSPLNNYEGSTQQPSYTWPYRHYKAGVIKQNAYMNTLKARNNSYLGL